MLSQIYLLSEVDTICVIVRRSKYQKWKYVINDIYYIAQRVAIDDYFRMCVLNGRINPLDDNFMTVSPKGKVWSIIL